jgi:hypothetical protein
MAMINKAKSVRPRLKRLELDEALIALFIGAMDANHHVAREELARAHHLIWSTSGFGGNQARPSVDSSIE